MISVHINIGSNIDRVHQLSQALNDLKKYFLQLECSSIYQSKAVGFEGDDFYNMGVNVRTLLSVSEINQYLRQIEDKQGRNRALPKFSARKIDLDLVLYGNNIDQKHNIPREDILKYSFVLAPLVELMPTTKHPITGQTYQTLWDNNPKQLLTKHTIHILGAVL